METLIAFAALGIIWFALEVAKCSRHIRKVRALERVRSASIGPMMICSKDRCRVSCFVCQPQGIRRLATAA